MFLQSKSAERLSLSSTSVHTESSVEIEPVQLTAIEKLLHWLFIVSPSTSSCERGFSLMNTLKNKLRTTLTQESLKNQLYLMSEGPDISNFDPVPCIKYWFEYSKGLPHCSGHKLKQKSEEVEYNFELSAK